MAVNYFFCLWIKPAYIMQLVPYYAKLLPVFLVFMKTLRRMVVHCHSPYIRCDWKIVTQIHNAIQMYISHQKHVPFQPPVLTLLGKDACGTHTYVSLSKV